MITGEVRFFEWVLVFVGTQETSLSKPPPIKTFFVEQRSFHILPELNVLSRVPMLINAFKPSQYELTLGHPFFQETSLFFIELLTLPN
jgi:hypothetical protein